MSELNNRPRRTAEEIAERMIDQAQGAQAYRDRDFIVTSEEVHVPVDSLREPADHPKGLGWPVDDAGALRLRCYRAGLTGVSADEDYRGNWWSAWVAFERRIAPIEIAVIICGLALLLFAWLWR